MYEFSGQPGKVIVSRDEVAKFNASWPGSTLRDRSYWFAFDVRTFDLYDTDVPEQDDGPASAAMADDCKAWLQGDVPAWAIVSKPSNAPETPTDGTYGAPLGRPTLDTFTDKQGNTHQLTVTPEAGPFVLRRVYLNNGGYDAGGAYWGHGAPLYYFEGPVSDISGYVRAKSRQLAKDHVRSLHPHARFHR